jgi:hypothetical protein
MERAAGLAAARNISWELYYHNCTSGVKCEVLKAVSQSSTTRFIVEKSSEEVEDVIG